MSKSIKSLALALVAIFAISAMPVSAQTTTIDALQAQIQALMAQLQALQGSGSSTGATCFAFTRSLTVGSTGSDVKALQQYLNANGFVVSTSGAGAVGYETTYFGYKTKVAVAKWQADKGVSPASGYFGPISQAKYRSLCTGTGTGTGTGTELALAREREPVRFRRRASSWRSLLRTRLPAPLSPRVAPLLLSSRY